jgi:hypothetical protein
MGPNGELLEEKAGTSSGHYLRAGLGWAGHVAPSAHSHREGSAKGAATLTEVTHLGMGPQCSHEAWFLPFIQGTSCPSPVATYTPPLY